jgi:hypothetical protein
VVEKLCRSSIKEEAIVMGMVDMLVMEGGGLC